MEVRAVKTKQEDIPKQNPPASLSTEDNRTEDDLLSFCIKQIEEMRKYLKLANSEGHPAFYEVNAALMSWYNIYMSLLPVYYAAKHEWRAGKNKYDNWYAEKYTNIRREENPKSISAQKFISTKEIEFILRMKHSDEISEMLSRIDLLEEKVSFVKRIIDGWQSHQFVLTQLSKNIMGETHGQKYE